MNRALLFLASMGLCACGWSVDPFAHEGSESDSAPCDEELTAFQASVYAPVLAVSCVGCHNAGGPARQTRFVLSTNDTDEARVANFRAARRVALEGLGGTSRT